MSRFQLLGGVSLALLVMFGAAACASASASPSTPASHLARFKSIVDSWSSYPGESPDEMISSLTQEVDHLTAGHWPGYVMSDMNQLIGDINQAISFYRESESAPINGILAVTGNQQLSYHVIPDVRTVEQDLSNPPAPSTPAPQPAPAPTPSPAPAPTSRPVTPVVPANSVGAVPATPESGLAQHLADIFNAWGKAQPGEHDENPYQILGINAAIDGQYAVANVNYQDQGQPPSYETVYFTNGPDWSVVTYCGINIRNEFGSDGMTAMAGGTGSIPANIVTALLAATPIPTNGS